MRRGKAVVVGGCMNGCNGHPKKKLKEEKEKFVRFSAVFDDDADHHRTT
jgi:hypothetical protein